MPPNLGLWQVGIQRFGYHEWGFTDEFRKTGF